MSFITAVRYLSYMILAILPWTAFAEPISSHSGMMERSAIEASVGTQYFYEGYSRPHPLAGVLREDYAIHIREVWKGGVSFQYQTKQKVMGDSEGMLTLSSLDDCKSLDPWWDPGETDSDTRCELWIPRKLFLSLITVGSGYFAVDTLMRHDDSVRWEVTGRVRYLCYEDGHAILLDAIQVKTSRNDAFVILDDPDNPLILKADSSYFGWSLREVRHRVE